MSDIVLKLRDGRWSEDRTRLDAAAEIERLCELVAFNEDQRRMLFDAAIKLEADRDRWKAIAEKRHAILLDLEWCKESDESYCPCCMAIDGETHIAGCKMAEAIAESARAANKEDDHAT